MKNVSFCLYAKKPEGQDYSVDKLFAEIDNIIGHIAGFRHAAAQFGHRDAEQPFFDIHVLFLNLPSTKQRIFAEFEAKLKDKFYASVENDEDVYFRIVTIGQFTLSSRELRYLSTAQNDGDIIDLMKIKVSITPQNRGKHHIILDSNTVILNYHEMYAKTFLCADKAKFYINVYSETHKFTINNKCVFLPAYHSTQGLLETRYEHFLTHNKIDKSYKEHKLKIYNHIFTMALKDIGVINERGFVDFSDAEIFDITAAIAPRVLQTWNQDALLLARFPCLQTAMHNSAWMIDVQVAHPTRTIPFGVAEFIGYLRKHTTGLCGPKNIQKHDQLFHRYAHIEAELTYLEEFIYAQIINKTHERSEFIRDIINFLSTQSRSQPGFTSRTETRLIACIDRTQAAIAVEESASSVPKAQTPEFCFDLRCVLSSELTTESPTSQLSSGRTTEQSLSSISPVSLITCTTTDESDRSSIASNTTMSCDSSDNSAVVCSYESVSTPLKILPRQPMFFSPAAGQPATPSVACNENAEKPSNTTTSFATLGLL